MKCTSCRHEWSTPLDAARCCSPDWLRVMRHIDNAADLAPDGRHYRRDLPFVYGWIGNENQQRMGAKGRL